MCGKEAYISGKYANGTICAECRGNLGIDGLIWGFDYRGKLAHRVIEALKYYGVRELTGPLVKILYNAYLSIPFALRPEVISDTTHSVKLLPIPLHKTRERVRGFNQGVLIAEELTRLSSWKLETNLLQRVKRTATQTELGRNERFANLSDVFALSLAPHSSATYILIDDIVTTGATMGSVAKLLKQNGAKFVWGMALAKG